MGNRRLRPVKCAFCGEEFVPRRRRDKCCSMDCADRLLEVGRKDGRPQPCHVCGERGVARMRGKWWCRECLTADDPEYDAMVRARLMGSSPAGLLPDYAPAPPVLTTDERRRMTGI